MSEQTVAHEANRIAIYWQGQQRRLERYPSRDIINFMRESGKAPRDTEKFAGIGVLTT